MTPDLDDSGRLEPTAADPVALWQGQRAPAFRLSPAALAAAEHEHARLRRRVTTKSAIMLFFLVLALYLVVTADILLARIGCMAAAAAYGRVLYTLQRTRRGDADDAAAEREGAGLAAPAFVHYRAALVRERDRLSGRRLWLPFAIAVPGVLVLLLGTAQARPALQRYLALEAALIVATMPVALLVGRRRARHLQLRIDELDALSSADDVISVK